MSEYIVSARKYRPLSFDTVVGQAALTTTLKNAVKSGKLAHAYLFCGPRGVGKTTCARIFAKTINCMSPTSDGEACNECESCKAFNEQRSFNIFELDAASNNSVEHIKTLMEQTRIPPQVGRYKVFIIDEVHMLSTAAFNAFLKTLEEPPAHVIFILATTEKHKILPTILSRCQIYDFERMTVANTVAHLKMVAEKEGITAEQEALEVIAEKADGGMRDALSIFDQAASFCQGNITYQKVIEDLNVLDAENYFRIVDLSLENKVPEVMVLLNDVINKGFDGGQLIAGLARHVRNVLMAKDVQTLSLLEASEQQKEKYKLQAQKADTRFLYQALRLMNDCDVNYRQSSNKRLLVELTLIEIAQITQPDDSVGSGRRPRQLKCLFQNIVRQQRQGKAAVQVAAAGGVADKKQDAKEETMVVQEQNGKQQRANYSTVNRPVLKAGSNVGFSWNKVREMSKRSKIQIVPGMLAPNDPNSKPITENNQFSQEDLELQWMSMCNRMPQKLSAIATRMKNMNPKIGEFPNVKVMVDNQVILEQMQQIQKSILNTLKLYLSNTSITLELVLTKHEEAVRILSRREQFEEMSKENPAVEKLREIMDLELA
ncbi:DNA polymerase III subunit gamma/tau [Prevotella sp. P2-180]|uniref:DNA polymerase III subunit gamma/tau n=1 Tax=Prevotella sp. P2-180 TaxID=2024224 RepID=UPI000B964BDE|nr:DNA polymerase III subunit gamma/tau [Prevotella sp. P2-180]MCI6339011.1 DNA polymerase III subunit gamma/tau [Prevotella sp.]MCI7257082.1 DNA polymerase III subunit gamma/tau [Prevotella sp.]MDD5783639.1 DNA polymerase III subunit gamma/tau [Prevotella sp.]MDD6863327.1 DNA polymerase III subunit gamma/tau [Prevotella sp.]MDD7224900.1 DNA polymerase III subunit gamma/tau [Prevotella sp.]